jgi:hypothetical protein
VLQRPFLDLSLILLLFDGSATHVEHASRLPLHYLAVFDNCDQVVSWQLYTLLSGKDKSIVSTFGLVSSTLSHALHLVELQDGCLAGGLFIGCAHCCYYKSPIRLPFVNMNIWMANFVKSHGSSEGIRNKKRWSFQLFLNLLLFSCQLHLRIRITDQVLLLYFLQILQLLQSFPVQLDLFFQFYLRIDSGNRFWVWLVDFRCSILLVARFTPADKLDEKDEDDE